MKYLEFDASNADFCHQSMERAESSMAVGESYRELWWKHGRCWGAASGWRNPPTVGYTTPLDFAYRVPLKVA